MIKLKNILNEISQEDANIANLAALGAETVEDITFKFKSKKMSPAKGVLIHDYITIEAFNLPDRESIQFQSYHLIFGESSMAIFDAFGVSETAGLSRNDCQAHLDQLKANGQSETWDGAFIAGLTNWSGAELYVFYNVGRMLWPGFGNRVLVHESLHLTRDLITINANEYIKQNQGKKDWWADDRAVFTKLEDSNEEYFAETLERCSAIAYSRWDNAKTMMKAPPKTKSTTSPSIGNKSGIDITQTTK